MSDPDLIGQAPPIPLEEAIAIVDGWSEWFGPWPLHQVARALRRGLAAQHETIVRFTASNEHELLDEAALDRVRLERKLIAANDKLLERNDEITALTKDRDAWMRRACTAVVTTNRVQEETAARLGTLRRENDELRREIADRAEDAAADADNDRGYINSLKAGIAQICEVIGIPRGDANWPEWIAGVREEVARRQDEHDKLQADYDKLAYQSRMMGLALVDAPDKYASLIEHYTLQRTLDLMDVWRPEVERWGLHQMCRVLRAEMERRDAAAQQWHDEFRQERRFALAHYRQAQRMDAASTRALAAIPCARAQDDCPCPDYRWAPCCNLRVALRTVEGTADKIIEELRTAGGQAFVWAGEPFETDYLADEGWIHPFAPVDPAHPRRVRSSVGCVKLVEPSIDGWDMEADAKRFDANLDDFLDRPEEALAWVEPTIYERNETLDWNFKR